MAEDNTDDDMKNAPRHVYGPRPVGALVPALTRPAFSRKAPASAQLMLDWPAIVGPALARVTEPRRLSAGTLTIACSGPIAMELQHMAIEVIHRINAHLGQATVRSLRFMQVADQGTLAPRPLPSPRTLAQAEAAVGDMPPGPLRDVLVSLGSILLGPGRGNGSPATKPPAPVDRR